MVDISIWFETLLFLINIVRKGVNNLDHLFGKILLTHGVLNEMHETLIPRSRLSFDSLEIKERIFLLECAYRLMEVSLDAWLSVCEQHNATQNSFAWSKGVIIPVSFLPVYQRLPKSKQAKRKYVLRTSNPTPPHVVINHWERLKRKIAMQQAYEKHRENN